MTQPAAERAAVYRFFGSDDKLLYVGVTERFGTRWSTHARQQPWWPQVIRQAVTWYGTRTEALAVEAAAIKAELPAHNIAHMPKPPRPPRRGEDLDHTFITRFRIPRRMWTAYGAVTERLGTDRSSDLVDHVRATIRAHGNTHEIAELEAAEQELAERRSRKGGRPAKGAS
ncbi:GIY-YIG nuclease family protein [Streptomyces lavendulae]|uniref:GIY-YIG nuclease family protein n=1 Tax=Streptomyces lavendulae TaxID=1914 RepID=UPI0036A51383